MSRIAIIGGGISGLACAEGLLSGSPDLDVVVLEAGDRPGGNIRTLEVSGFRFEAGPNGWLNRHPSTLALAVRLGLQDELLTGCEAHRKRFVLADGRLSRFPDSPATFLTTDLLSVASRLRMLLEPLVRAGRAEETVGQFARRRLGKGAAAHLVEPVVSGIYAGDPELLSVRDALPQLAVLEAEGRSLLRAYVKARREPPHGTTDGVSPTAIGRRRLVSFRGGAGSLIAALQHRLGRRLRCDSPVRSVRSDGSRFRVLVGGSSRDELPVDAVISAAPAHAAAGYLADLDPDLASACAAVPHSPVAVVALGFREADVPHPLDGFGYLVSGEEGGSVLGVHWSSSIFPGHRSPPGSVVLQAILGGARDPAACELPDDELVDRSCNQLEQALGVAAAPVHVRVFRHARGLPQYVVGHGRRRAAVEAAESRRPGLFVTGNAWRGVGMNACTADAERVVERALRHLLAEARPGAGTARAVAR